MREFKHHSTFATKHIRIVYPNDKSMSLALASLKDLKDVLPAGLDIEGNPDLVFNSFNAVVVNRINLNDDGIKTADALAIAKKFIHKPYDLEHNRKFIVGACISQGYSEFLTNKMLTEDQVREMNGPFNITLGGVVWSIFNPDFADQLVEASDETSLLYETISASWEIGFDEYHIALGSKDLAQAEMITDPTQVQEFSQYLKIAKGSGQTKDGVPVYRVITGDALPLGIGYTTTPAADVKGVAVVTKNKESGTIINANEIIQICTKEFIKQNNELANHLENVVTELKQVAVATQKENSQNQKTEKNNSQLGSDTVKSNSIMKFKSLEDISVDLFKDETVGAAANNFFGKFVNDKIEEVSTEYAEKLEAKQKEAQAEADKAAELKKQLDDALAQIQKAQEDLKKEQEVRAAAKAEADFNLRMTDLDSKFNLDDKDRSFIVQDIKGLDEDAYAKWVEKFEVFAGSKKKQPVNNGQQAQASAEEVLNNAKEENNEAIVNNTATETNIRQEFADAFKLEAFKIKK